MMNRSNMPRSVAAVALAVCLLCFTPAQAKKPDNTGGGGGDGGTPSYDITKLDDMNGLLEGSAHDINGSRLIVGHVIDSISAEETVARAAYWTVTQTRRSVDSTLHLLDDGGVTSTGAYGCNEAGEIVGGGLGTPLYWADPQARPLVLPLPTDSLSGSPSAISNDGVICGGAKLPSSSPDASQGWNTALVWRVTEAGVWGPLVLESDPDAEYSVEASAVSDQVEGVVTIAGRSNGSAVTWTVTLAEDGGLVLNSTSTLSGSAVAEGINNLGVVCGWDWTFNEAVLWIGGIPWILERETPPDVSGYPLDINDDGVIVGESRSLFSAAVVWSSPDAAMVRLDKYLKKSPFSSLRAAEAVSQSGDIVGDGWISDPGYYTAFLAISK